MDDHLPSDRRHLDDRYNHHLRNSDSRYRGYGHDNDHYAMDHYAHLAGRGIDESAAGAGRLSSAPGPQKRYCAPGPAYEEEWTVDDSRSANVGGLASGPRPERRAREESSSMDYCWRLVDHARETNLPPVSDG